MAVCGSNPKVSGSEFVFISLMICQIPGHTLNHPHLMSYQAGMWGPTNIRCAIAWCHFSVEGI